MLALFGVYFLNVHLSVDPYVALIIMVPAAFVFGYALQRSIIGKTSHGKDQNILLVTLAIAVIIENMAVYLWRSDTRTIDVPYGFEIVDFGFAFVPVPRLVAFFGALIVAALLWGFMRSSDTGRAIRAVAKERQGAKLVGINVDHIYALSYGIGCACLAAAACFLLPMFYVTPQVGNTFVLIAFTVVVLGGMGSFAGALLGGFIIGITESISGLFLGESLGQIGIFLIFILVLLLRPTGLFGERS